VNRFLVIIIAVVVIGISIFSYLSLNDTPANSESYTQEFVAEPLDDTGNVKELEYSGHASNSPIETNPIKGNVVNQSVETNDSILPFNVSLLGLVYSKVPSESYTQLQSEGNIAEYFVDEEVNNTQVYVKRINKKSVVLEFESAEYELKLGEENTLEEQNLQVEFTQMTPKEIGSRPRKIEHIVRLLPNLFNDGGKLIIPGQNPALFSAARFKEGDVLLEVNGFNIDDESDFSDLQKHIRNAQTLKFVVNRAGRQITLYLDIPSEALKM
jgi:type II secretion system protein C